jgi:hypothetical protein
MYKPSWPANVNEAQALTRAAFDLASDVGDTGRIQTTNQFRHDSFAFVQNLSHNADGEKIISGLDTRGASSNMAFMATGLVMPVDPDPTYGHIGTPSGIQAVVWAVCTSSIEISAGQNLVVIF